MLFLCLCNERAGAQDVLDLSGQWEFQADRADKGVTEKWYGEALDDRILLPGSMPQRLKGDRPSVRTQWTGSLYDSSFFYNPFMEQYRREENFKLPFFLTPDRHYVGTAWYRKTVNVPAEWRGRRMVLFLERPHIETELWVNGKKAGKENSLCVPHCYDVTEVVKPGENTLALRVDNRIDGVCVGADSHSVTDQTQGNWNGIVGRIELQSTPLIYADDIQVYPDIHQRTATVRLVLKQHKAKGHPEATVTLSAKSFNTDVAHEVQAMTRQVKLDKGKAEVEMVLELGEGMQLWDEFSPALYELSATVASDEGTDHQTRTFGMREFKVDGKMFYVNGRVTQLRGTVENCDFPLTGYAPMDEVSWERVFRICRSYGLNHMRFHSFCPPEAAFAAADRVGFYLQPEGPSWPNHGVKLGNGMYIDQYLMEETRRMNKAYGNHASFCMLACGNEPAGNWVEWVSGFVDYWKRTDSRHVYTGASVGGGWAWQPKSMYHVKAGVRGLDEWRRRAPETVTDFRAKIDTVSVPFVSHETGQWCVFPNFDEISKYTGVNKARNFEIFRDILEHNHMGRMAHKFMMASGKLQLLCYKHEIERTMRTPHYAGFQLLALNDYSGQGTALVGLTDVFFDEKEYCSPEDFREFCSPTVLLARIPKFTYWNDETFSAALEVSHFGKAPIRGAEAVWRITDKYGKVLAQDAWSHKDIPLGCNISLGDVQVDLSACDAPCQLVFEVELKGVYDDLSGKKEEVCSKNHWNFWVYPKATLEELKGQEPEEGLYVTDTLDEKAEQVLKDGGKVLVMAAGKITYGRDVVQQFTPVFWNTSWFKMRPPHTTGLYIENYHPLFRNFPTDYHSDMQWWELVNRQQVMQFTEFPADFQPIVQSIDTWFLSRKIGMLFEARVGGGRLVMTTMPLDEEEASPVKSQMRKAILDYMASDDFRPQYTVDLQCVKDLFTKEAPKVNMYTKDSPDELKPKLNVTKK